MTTQVKSIILAPMEGVVDVLMRKLLCSINQYDLCITEFLRVVDKLEPKHRFYTVCPELKSDSRTANNTPVRIQLLGQEPDWLAENANRAIELGSKGIDINFGCPAKAVNKSKGGAVLLKDPELIFQIMKTVRSAVDSSQVVSAKVRLGFDDTSLFKEIIDAIYQAQVNTLTVHARTKSHGYKPPAYWHHIGEIPQYENFEVIANGEIWSAEDAIACMEVSNTQNIMLGRGALAMPNLCNVIKFQEQKMDFNRLVQLIFEYARLEDSCNNFYFSSRLKQWLKYLKLQFSEGDGLFTEIKRLNNKNDILTLIQAFASNAR
ncbi:MAG: tRNA-dihydrouridine synthase [Thalassotalea sp.]